MPGAINLELFYIGRIQLGRQLLAPIPRATSGEFKLLDWVNALGPRFPMPKVVFWTHVNVEQLVFGNDVVVETLTGQSWGSGVIVARDHLFQGKCDAKRANFN